MYMIGLMLCAIVFTLLCRSQMLTNWKKFEGKNTEQLLKSILERCTIYRHRKWVVGSLQAGRPDLLLFSDLACSVAIVS